MQRNGQRFRLAAMAINALALLWCVGCATVGSRPQTASGRRIERTISALLAAGDADSLAAASLLGPAQFDPEKRLAILSRAASAAPDRADLIWLNIQGCTRVASCDPEPISAKLRALDPDNGAGWWYSVSHAVNAKDTAAVRRNLSAMASATRLDLYWNTTVVHVAEAVAKTKTMNTQQRFTLTVGAAAAFSIPPFQSIVNACKGEALNDPSVVDRCRQVSTAMQRGDTYLTEMIGVAIARHVWPEASLEYSQAVSARRLARYQIDAQTRLFPGHIWNRGYAARHLQLMAQIRTEQAVASAEILQAGLPPNPPAAWIDKRE